MKLYAAGNNSVKNDFFITGGFLESGGGYSPFRVNVQFFQGITVSGE
jgi:hypothetical protein